MTWNKIYLNWTKEWEPRTEVSLSSESWGPSYEDRETRADEIDNVHKGSNPTEKQEETPSFLEKQERSTNHIVTTTTVD